MKRIILMTLLLAVGSFAFTQDMKNMPGMKMPGAKVEAKKTTSANSGKLIYTCVMHPEVKMDKPGNCPKCGMRLVKEKPKAAAKKVEQNHEEMQRGKETSNQQSLQEKPNVSEQQKHDGMQMPIKDSAQKKDDMSSMNMEGMNMGGADMDNIKLAKANLGPIKTITNNAPPHTVVYHLYIRDTVVTFGKKPKRAIAVNGQIPMPTLTFTEGDTAEIWVHNQLKEETSLHWHGLFLPNKMDGVPFVTQMPIKPGAIYLYKFPIIQHGTHWYHSHSGLQEQLGMYGSFIMNKREEWNIPTIPVVLSEWLDMNPNEANRSLHAATDWFAVQKGATQSYSEAIKLGWFKTKVTNEWKRMTAMDLTDIYYDNLFINGKNQSEQPQFKAGDKVRLRIANGGASDYFWLSYSGGKITVVATDGNDVEPVEVDRLIIAVSETYDIVLTIPDNKSYEFMITPEDRTKHASMWLGSGEKVPAVKLKRPKYFAGMKMMNDMMDMRGNLIPMEGMDMKNQIMDMNTVMYPEITGDEIRGPKKVEKMNKKMIAKKPAETKNMDGSENNMPGMNMDNSSADIVSLNYEMLKSPEKTTLRAGPVKELYFTLTGNMNRYVWSIDNKVVSEADKILIKKGENVRIILYNNTMMRHPMHLHGHDFRLLNGQGEYAIMKNIIDIMPMERDTIEFAATEPGGDWFFHCHILYHMMAGMGRVFSYQDTLVDKTDITSSRVARRGLNADTRTPHPMARIGLESTGSDGELMFANTRYRLQAEWRIGTNERAGYETESHFGRFLGRMQWWLPYIGWDFRKREIDPFSKSMFGQRLTLPGKNLFGQANTKNFRRAVHVGIQYTLPMLVIADASVDSDGKYRFQLSREDIPLTARMRMLFLVNTDKEYIVGLRYIVSKYFNFSTHYDNDMGWGAGITITY